MFVVGLTGGIGSGKTAVSDRFAQLGIEVVDLDTLLEKAKVRFKFLGADGLDSIFSRMRPLGLATSLPRLFSEEKAEGADQRYLLISAEAVLVSR